jgi:hypothetical protein
MYRQDVKEEKDPLHLVHFCVYLGCSRGTIQWDLAPSEVWGILGIFVNQRTVVLCDEMGCSLDR